MRDSIRSIRGLFAAVLEHLQTGHDHRDSELLDVELRGGDHVLRGHRQEVIARVKARVRVLGERQLFEDDVAAGDGLDVAALAQSSEQGVVLGDVVRDGTRPRLDGGRDDVADVGVGESHDESPRK
jgi:hypothetical protein